ncbi:hypothetical protein B0H10DRAFT_1977438 [Mycena sp. CBHHK59/15]|nr:hypothetical protein B0H10DRAFT_1977438 [Mycena sp. CBHHK59/15]
MQDSRCSQCGQLEAFRVPEIPRSPLPHLLRNEVVPTTAEIAAVLDVTLATDRDICLIDGEIERLRSVIASLTACRTEIVQFAPGHTISLQTHT